MAPADHLDTLDIAELTVSVSGWPAGTIGTLVDRVPGGFFFEVAGENGRTRGLFEVPKFAIKVPEPTTGVRKSAHGVRITV